MGGAIKRHETYQKQIAKKEGIVSSQDTHQEQTGKSFEKVEHSQSCRHYKKQVFIEEK